MNKTNKFLVISVVVSFGLMLYFLARINGWGEESLGITGGSVSYANLVGVFLAGLFVGGLSCLAVQGGLLAATVAQRAEQNLTQKELKSGDALPIIFFLAAKLGAYTILGFLLGWFGSFFELSVTTRVIMQIAVVIFMIGTALNLLNVHPIFRYFVIQPPHFLTRMVRKKSKSSSIFAPVMLGALTVLIPCGVTQGMMALAIGSGNPLLGALIMLAFTLGTSPVFFALGYFTTKLSESTHKKFMRIAAFGIILLAIFNLNSAIALTGSSKTLGNIFGNSGGDDSKITNSPAVSEATIIFGKYTYQPEQVTVKAGSQVKLHLENREGYGCIQAFTIPELDYQRIIPVGGKDTITFDAPDTPGDIPFMCSMGMYRGVIHVI